MRNKEEYNLCKSISIYLKLQYPDVIFHFDLAGLNLSKTQAGMMKAIQGRGGFPDLMILKPKGIYHGMFLEIKKTSTKIENKKGKLANPHLQKQFETLIKLGIEKYYVNFAIGFDDCKYQIDTYLK